MAELKKFPVFVVNVGDQDAVNAVKKLCDGVKPGSVVPLSDREFQAFLKNVVELDLSCVR